MSVSEPPSRLKAFLQGDAVIGMAGQIQFRQFPRQLMDRFFSPGKGGHTAAAAEAPKPQPAPAPTVPAPVVPAPVVPAPALVVAPAVVVPAPAAASAPAAGENALLGKVYDMVEAETGLERFSLAEDTLFTIIGVDSLMSLVLAEKSKAQLAIVIKSSLFLECPKIGEFHSWLEESR